MSPWGSAQNFAGFSGFSTFRVFLGVQAVTFSLEYRRLGNLDGPTQSSYKLSRGIMGLRKLERWMVFI